jgi:hypothetical protein
MENTYCILVLDQTLVVAAQANQENNAGDILKIVDPFLPFTLLHADIDHKHLMVRDEKDEKLRKAASTFYHRTMHPTKITLMYTRSSKALSVTPK